MNERAKQGLAVASAIGAALFIGVFGWLFVNGLISFGLFVVLAGINLLVGLVSAKLALRGEG